ncbi:MAG: type II toxin-antitoxin system HicB family antitoxin [Chloroflexia bacterium]
MTSYILPVVIEKDADGYFVYCPSLQGCYTQGETYEEAMANIQDAMRLHIQDRLAKGEKIPASDAISFAALEVRA